MVPEIIFEDEGLLVLNKPAGLAVHRSAICHDASTVVDWVREHRPGQVHPVHRLDAGTSGILLFAKDGYIARLMMEQFSQNLVRKSYLCVVRGFLPESGDVNSPLRANDAPEGELQEAHTVFKRLAWCELEVAVSRYPTTRYSLAMAHPTTGRMHQIRRHFAHIRHPIVGDSRHGDGAHNRFFRSQGIHRLLLFSVALEFSHPLNGQPMNFSCPPDAETWNQLQQLPWTPDVQVIFGQALSLDIPLTHPL